MHVTILTELIVATKCFRFGPTALCNVTRAGESVYVIRIKQKNKKRRKSLAVPKAAEIITKGTARAAMLAHHFLCHGS